LYLSRSRTTAGPTEGGGVERYCLDVLTPEGGGAESLGLDVLTLPVEASSDTRDKLLLARGCLRDSAQSWLSTAPLGSLILPERT
jgi:hypothetical protein